MSLPQSARRGAALFLSLVGGGCTLGPQARNPVDGFFRGPPLQRVGFVMLDLNLPGGGTNPCPDGTYPLGAPYPNFPDARGIPEISDLPENAPIKKCLSNKYFPTGDGYFRDSDGNFVGGVFTTLKVVSVQPTRNPMPPVILPRGYQLQGGYAPQ